MALRLARVATGKPVVVKFDHHFHGWHDYVAASSKYASHAPAGVPDSTMESVLVIAATAEAVEETLAARDDIAAVIVEAAGAASGSEPLPEGFHQALRAATERHGVVLIFDEVVTGFRWSPGGVQQLEGVTPDLTTLAKILAGGFPGGAVAGRRDLLDYIAFTEPGQAKRAKVGHPGTFNANPLSAAAGVACLREVADGSHQQRSAELAGRLRAGMNGELCRLGIPGVAYGQTSDLRFRLGVPFHAEATDYHPRSLPQSVFESPSNPEADRLLSLALLNCGVFFFGTGGFASSAHSEEDIERTVEAWGDALEAVASEVDFSA
jgi:glutamate-1-semialdehyde 2,1-aminomutase